MYKYKLVFINKRYNDEFLIQPVAFTRFYNRNNQRHSASITSKVSFCRFAAITFKND